MINKKQAKEIINKALSSGGDYADIYIEDTNALNIVLENGEVESVAPRNSFGAGLRILKGNNSVYAHTNEVNYKSLISLAESLSLSFNDKQITECQDFKSNRTKKNCSIIKHYDDIPLIEKINLCKKTDTYLKEYSELIVRRTVVLGHVSKNKTIITSNGKFIKNKEERCRLNILAVAMKNGVIDTGFEGPGTTAGFEFFENLNIKEKAEQAAKEAVENVSAKECPSGKMDVVIGNGFGGVLFHEACGHPLEASSVSKGLSVFSNKLGEMIASPLVTAIDDGTLLNRWGTNNVDDEGNPTKKNVLIKNGKLVGYMVDSFTGRRMNASSNGCSRRQNYTFEPTSRMSNTYIDKGESDPKEIIKNTKLGLYAERLGGGSVNPATGEFEFAVSTGFIIRDGQIKERVRGATLIGQGFNILKNIDMVGNDLVLAEGYCGAESGNIPVCVGQPTIRIKDILVGGKGGKIDEYK